MDKRQGRQARLEIGMVVVRTPQTIFEEEHGKEIRRPRQGQVDYIHPLGRFHIVAFRVRGKQTFSRPRPPRSTTGHTPAACLHIA